jgi:predicted secreted protein
MKKKIFLFIIFTNNCLATISWRGNAIQTWCDNVIQIPDQNPETIAHEVPGDLGVGNLDENRIVKAGEEFTITVFSDPTTGADWTVEPLDDKFLQFISDRVIRDTALENPLAIELDEEDIDQDDYVKYRLHVGGEGRHVEYRFKALKPGTTKLIMKYGQSWMPKPWKINTYTIDIEKADEKISKQITAAVGDSFHISREPGLGQERFEYDPQFLELTQERIMPAHQSHSYTDPDGETYYFGMILPTFYTFKALKAGNTLLKLISTDPATVYSVTILPSSIERLDGFIY